jgi:sugar phosphate isomerase/epimerase
MAVELALTPDGRWAVGIDALIGAARGAGFSGLGLSAALASHQVADAYSANGLRCHELLALVLSDDASETISAAESLAEAAAIARAEWILTVFSAGLTSQSASVIATCAKLFSEVGAKMAVEFSPLGPVPTIQAGLDVVEAAGEGRAGLLIDTWHFSFGESTWEDLGSIPIERIAYVQFADALAPITVSLGRETMHRRAMPGDGVLDLDRFATTLLDRGWDGLVSVEVLSQELRELPVAEFALLAHTGAARYWIR